MTAEVVIFTFLLILAVIVPLAVIYFMQQRMLRDRESHEARIHKVEEEYQDYISEIKSMHTTEMQQLRTRRLEPASPKVVAGSEDSTEYKSKMSKAEKKAEDIINDANTEAKAIVSEAQARAKKIITEQEKEMHKSIVKVVIQVVRKVLGKTLTYEDHKKVILDSLKDL